MKPISLVPLIALAMPETAYAADILSDRYNNLSCAVFQVTAGENPQGSPRSLGTGFFIDSNGRMVTAAHVLLGAKDKSGNSTMQQPQRIILGDKTIIDIPVTE
jgi:S1-C subfamily serine protease